MENSGALEDTTTQFNKTIEWRVRRVSEAEQLEKLCKPVVDWLKKNHDPHTEVHITVDHIDLMESVIGIPVE